MSTAILTYQSIEFDKQVHKLQLHNVSASIPKTKLRRIHLILCHENLPGYSSRASKEKYYRSAFRASALQTERPKQHTSNFKAVSQPSAQSLMKILRYIHTLRTRSSPYQPLLHSPLEYACSVWDQHLKKDRICWSEGLCKTIALLV